MWYITGSLRLKYHFTPALDIPKFINLQLNQKCFIISQSLLVQVKAAGVNPLDLWMSEGYGYAFFELMRSKAVGNFSTFNPFPMTLGRDFSGVVVDKGMAVDDYQVGDEVGFQKINFP